jgi:hypothetical protein
MFIFVIPTLVFVIWFKMGMETSTNSTLNFHPFTKIAFIALLLIMTLKIDSFEVVLLMVDTQLVMDISG